MSVSSSSASTTEGPSVFIRELCIICGAFFITMSGSAALQQYLAPLLEVTRGWGEIGVMSVLATLYFFLPFGRLFAPLLVSALGARLVIAVGLAAYGFLAAAILLPLPAAVYPGAAILGWGAAAAFTAATVYVLDRTPQTYYGRASAAFFGSNYIGRIFGVLLFGVVGKLLGWSGLAVRLIPLWTLLVAAVGAILVLQIRPPRLAKESISVPAVFRRLFQKGVILNGLLLAATYLGFGMVVGGLATTTKQLYGAGLICWVTLPYYIFRVAGGMAGGALSDFVGRKRVFVAAFFASSVGLAVPAANMNPFTLGLGAAALGVLTGVMPIITSASIGDAVKGAARTPRLSATFLWGDVGVLLGVLGSILLKRGFGSFRVSLLVFAGIYLVCALASIAFLRNPQQVIPRRSQPAS